MLKLFFFYLAAYSGLIQTQQAAAATFPDLEKMSPHNIYRPVYQDPLHTVIQS